MVLEIKYTAIPIGTGALGLYIVPRIIPVIAPNIAGIVLTIKGWFI
jgi:hypothetical protein